MKKYFVCFLVYGLLCTACGNNQQKKVETADPPVFPALDRPITMTDPQTIADYMTRHYWDKFDFTDTLFLSHPDVLEQAMVDYIVVLPYASGDQGKESIAKLMQQAQADTAMYRFFVEKTEHYLWDPNSPYRNDELYIPVLEVITASEKTDDATRLRSEYRLERARKNRIGTVATDFTYTLENGNKGKMSQIRSEYLLLFFNNPGCAACGDIIRHTQASPLMNRLVEDRRLKILALYPDEDLTEWKKYLRQMPETWINSYDPDGVIKHSDLYDLKAIPTLYLLDHEKQVILKDADIREVEQYLQRNALQ